jgi:hypothetical protein
MTRIRRLLAVVMVALLALPALPVMGADRSTITINEDALTAARSQAGTEVNGIKYVAGVETPDDSYAGYVGKGVYELNSNYDYKLEENIILDQEAFVVEGNDIEETLNLDMAGKTLTYKDSVEYKNGGIRRELALLNAKKIELAIVGNGSFKIGDQLDPEGTNIIECDRTVISGGDFEGEIVATNGAIIDAGTFHNMLSINYLGVIHSGTFMDKVKVEGTGAILEGTFRDSLIIEGRTAISGGTFEEVKTSGDVIIEGGKINYLGANNGDDDKAHTLIITGGEFIFTGDGNDIPLETWDMNVIIEGGTFINKNKSGDPLWTPAVDINGNEFQPKVTIEGGHFESGPAVQYAVMIQNCGEAHISGGTFMGTCGGLMIGMEGDDSTDITLSGGVFRTTGTTDEDGRGGIGVAMSKEKTKDYYDESFFKGFLGEGKVFSPEVEVTWTGKKESYRDCAVYTQRDIAVVNANAEEESSVNEAAQAIIDELVTNGKAEGVDPALAEAIIKAVSEGKEVRMQLVINEVKAEDVGEDANLITESLATGKNLVGFVTIDFEVTIEGEHVGNIANAGKTIKFKLPIPKGLPAVPPGKVRIFALLRAHEGKVEELSATENGEYLESESALYSTFAITYADVVKSPNTGDNTPLLFFIMLTGLAGLVGVYEYKHKRP